MAGMTGALIVTLLAIAAFVGVRAINRDPLEVEPEAVDYLPVVVEAQRVGLSPAYPPELPQGWLATSVELRPGESPSWALGMLTAEEEFAGLRQGGDTLDGLVRTYVDEDAVEGDAAEVDGALGGTWRTFSDAGGDLAFATELDGEPLLVYGSASEEDLTLLLSRLTTAAR